MPITLLLIAGIVIAVAAVCVTIARPCETALAGETTAVGLADAGAETLVGNHGAGDLPRQNWQMTTVSALCEAEDILDSLEAHGIAERELVVLGNSCFAVRWR